MSEFLDSMVEGSRRRLREAKRLVPSKVLEEEVARAPEPRPITGFGDGFDVIAEVKPRSPAEGRLPQVDPVEQARAYEAGGAAMLSVLTEPDAFEGSLEALRAVAAVTSLPVMAKDFFVDPYQIHQARAAGADGVLLIARVLDDSALVSMKATAADLGMFCLLEVFDEEDLTRVAGSIGAGTLLGVNCRDLTTLSTDPGRHRSLAPLLPEGVVAVAESGMGSAADVAAVASLGYRAALVGTALMRSGEPSATLEEMVEAGRSSVVSVP